MIRELQRAVFANKVAKAFNTTDIPLEFCYLSSEIAEAFEAYRKDLPTIGEELADVAIYYDKESMYNPDLKGVEVSKLRPLWEESDRSPHTSMP